MIKLINHDLTQLIPLNLMEVIFSKKVKIFTMSTKKNANLWVK